MEKRAIRKVRWFWAWQDELEEAWLCEMSRQGWHLQKIVFPTVYQFIEGEPKSYSYRLDYTSKIWNRNDYTQQFQDAGWEHILEMAGWQYYRKVACEGEMPELYSNVESKIQKYRRLLGFVAFILGMLVIISVSILSDKHSTFFIGLKIIYLILIAIYLYSTSMLALKIRKLRES
jgi:hypothetical protein